MKKVGYITRTHGKQGELQCRLERDLDDDVTFIFLTIDGIPVPWRVEGLRYKGDDALLQLARIDTEEKAQKLVGCEVSVEVSAEDANDEEWLWTDFEGWTIHKEDGSAVGSIRAIDDSTENILAELTDGTLIPLHEDLITDIDETTQTITMQIPEGIIKEGLL